MLPTEMFARMWESIVGEVPGSERPSVERLPDDRLMFRVRCGMRNGGVGRIVIAMDESHTEWLEGHLRRELATACPYSRRFL